MPLEDWPSLVCCFVLFFPVALWFNKSTSAQVQKLTEGPSMIFMVALGKHDMLFSQSGHGAKKRTQTVTVAFGHFYSLFLYLLIPTLAFFVYPATRYAICGFLDPTWLNSALETLRNSCGTLEKPRQTKTNLAIGHKMQ